MSCLNLPLPPGWMQSCIRCNFYQMHSYKHCTKIVQHSQERKPSQFWWQRQNHPSICLSTHTLLLVKAICYNFPHSKLSLKEKWTVCVNPINSKSVSALINFKTQMIRMMVVVVASLVNVKTFQKRWHSLNSAQQYSTRIYASPSNGAMRSKRMSRKKADDQGGVCWHTSVGQAVRGPQWDHRAKVPPLSCNLFLLSCVQTPAKLVAGARVWAEHGCCFQNNPNTGQSAHHLCLVW